MLSGKPSYDSFSSFEEPVCLNSITYTAVYAVNIGRIYAVGNGFSPHGLWFPLISSIRNGCRYRFLTGCAPLTSIWAATVSSAVNCAFFGAASASRPTPPTYGGPPPSAGLTRLRARAKSSKRTQQPNGSVVRQPSTAAAQWVVISCGGAQPVVTCCGTTIVHCYGGAQRREYQIRNH